MPERLRSRALKGSPPSSSSSSTSEGSEKLNMKNSASKSKNGQGSLLGRILGQTFLYSKSAVLLVLLGIYSNVSQLALSPVYGSIPSSQWHAQTLMVGCFLGWAGNLALRQVLPIKTAKLLPLVAICVPFIQFYLFGFSQALGPRWGPAVTEGATLVPLAMLTASCVADYAEGMELGILPGFVAEAAPGIVSWGVLQKAQSWSAQHIQAHIGEAFYYTRMGMEVVLAAAYAVLAPSVYLVLTVPAMLHTAMINTHVMTPAGTTSLNGSMVGHDWVVLDRRESLTGYISVTQNIHDMARVMRADHSILGGDWLDFRGEHVTEPVYSVFVMLEAVRLVEREKPLADSDASALVIGLGIGNLPSALVTHGIDTTVVEIDAAVYEFAVKYFQLRENNPAVIEDAVSYADRLAKQGNKTFDYIVHDVFTGGAEPVDLFTLEFFEDLYALLNDEGVIAINYAGDLTLPPPKIILQTIRSVFPTCRIYRENPRDAHFFAMTGSDYTNLIFFCRKTTTTTTSKNQNQNALTFRKPVEADYLDSRARYAYLEPKHEVFPRDLLGEGDADGSEAATTTYGVLRKGDTRKVLAWHRRSAMGHWMIMRNVLRASFWENW